MVRLKGFEFTIPACSKASILSSRFEDAHLQEEGAAAQSRCTKAEQERDKMLAVNGLAQKHIQELVNQIVTIEQSKHKIEQDCQEETLQLRQRILSESQIRQVCTVIYPADTLIGPSVHQGLSHSNSHICSQKAELDLNDVAARLADCGQQLEKAEAAKMELTGQVQNLKNLVETHAATSTLYEELQQRIRCNTVRYVGATASGTTACGI